MMRKTLVTVLVLLLSCMCATIQAQDAKKSVSGTVHDSSGSPLIGVSIHEKGTSNGIISDLTGNFVLPCSPNATLVFSYLGYKAEEVNVNSRSVINVIMLEDAKVLDEVIVVAYGTAKKSSYTGAASLVKADAIKDLPTTTFENALTGKISGVQVTNSTGQAGSAPSIRIRGVGSMNASNDPLYVIDGVPVISGAVGQMGGNIYTSNDVMNTLNPSDIESISILKDAAASSLYGSRAANGVILITTKKGKEGKPTVSFKASMGFTPSWATDNYEAASTQEQVNMLYMVFHDYNTSGGKSEAAASTDAINRLNTKFRQHGYEFSVGGPGLYENVNILEYDNSGRGGKYFDWDKAYFRTAVYQTYDMSVSGATPTSNYYTSLSYTKDEGRLKVNSFDRVSGRANLSQKIGKFFEFATNVSVARTNNEGFNDTRNTSSNYFMQTRNLSWGLYWPTNYKTDQPWTARYGSYAYNNLYYDTQWENSSVNTKLSAAETLTLHLLPGLDVRSIFSYDNTTIKDHLYFSTNHYSGSSSTGVVYENRTIYEKLVSSTTANYNKQIEQHSIGLLVGFEAEKNTTDWTRATGKNMPVSNPHTVSMGGTMESAGYNWGNSMVSILSKLDYNYDERYFISGSFRRDASSRLSPDTRWGNFWSVSGAWNLHKETFIKDLLPSVNELRLRVSYGANGTLPTNSYGYMNLVSYTNKYMGAPGGYISTIADDKLSWETNYTTNIGIDFALFDQRLRGTIEYFNRTSKNLLQDMPISMTTGFTSTLRNIGRINNQGVEIELSGDIIKTKSLTWNLGANISLLSSKVKKLYGGADIIWYDPTGSDDRAKYIYREGQPVLSFYGYEWAGVDKTNGASVYYVNDPADQTKGDFLLNGRGATYNYNKANNTIIGDATPDAYGGINTSLSYKGIDLGLNFIYKIGGTLYDASYKDVADDGYYWERIRAKSYYDNMWTEQNPNGSQPKIRGTDLEDAMQFSSRMAYNASFIRLKNLSLGYSIPTTLTNKVWIQRARVFFNASNIWTFANYKEADPEVNSYGTRGWETPIGKTFVFGIELNF